MDTCQPRNILICYHKFHFSSTFTTVNREKNLCYLSINIMIDSGAYASGSARMRPPVLEILYGHWASPQMSCDHKDRDGWWDGLGCAEQTPHRSKRCSLWAERPGERFIKWERSGAGWRCAGSGCRTHQLCEAEGTCSSSSLPSLPADPLGVGVM